MSILCELCGLKYENEMIVDKQHCDFTQCYDCLFSMNFNDQSILKGSMGYNLQQYIDISKKYHTLIQEIPCNRLSDSGGCYVCMFILDIPLQLSENCKAINNEKLIPFDNPNLNQNQNIISTESKKDNTSTAQLEPFITHDINIYDNIININGNSDIMLSL